jgi:hypothetical protein
MSSWYEALMSSAQDEPTALGKIMWYGIFQLAAIVASIVFFVWFFTLLFSMILSQTSLDVITMSVSPFLWTFAPVISALSFASIFCLWSGLRSLSNLDKGKFSTPATFLKLMMVAVAVAWVGWLSYQWSPLISTILTFGTLLVLMACIIGGVIFGLWRVGGRYNDGLIKNGAIFTIIPILRFVAPILIIVGARSARGKVLGGIVFTTREEELPQGESAIDTGDKLTAGEDDEDII